MSNHRTHESLPSGFHFADRLQVDSFMATGSIDGAAKVCMVAGAGELPRLATRLRPPRDWTDEQRKEYKDGYRDGKKGEGVADGPHAYVQGWLDGAWGRMKWHLPHCSEHHNVTGCGVRG